MCFDFFAFISIVWNAAGLLTLDWCTLHSCSIDVGFCLWFFVLELLIIYYCDQFTQSMESWATSFKPTVSVQFSNYIFFFYCSWFSFEKVLLTFLWWWLCFIHLKNQIFILAADFSDNLLCQKASLSLSLSLSMCQTVFFHNVVIKVFIFMDLIKRAKLCLYG